MDNKSTNHSDQKNDGKSNGKTHQDNNKQNPDTKQPGQDKQNKEIKSDDKEHKRLEVIATNGKSENDANAADKSLTVADLNKKAYDRTNEGKEEKSDALRSENKTEKQNSNKGVL